jgi:hypothetical protein
VLNNVYWYITYLTVGTALPHFDSFPKAKGTVGVKNKHCNHNNDENYQLDATTVVYYHKLSLQVSAAPRGLQQLHLVLNTIRSNIQLVLLKMGI